MQRPVIPRKPDCLRVDRGTLRRSSRSVTGARACNHTRYRPRTGRRRPSGSRHTSTPGSCRLRRMHRDLSPYTHRRSWQVHSDRWPQATSLHSLRPSACRLKRQPQTCPPCGQRRRARCHPPRPLRVRSPCSPHRHPLKPVRRSNLLRPRPLYSRALAQSSLRATRVRSIAALADHNAGLWGSPHARYS